MDPTIRYYDENAIEFFENTKNADMKELYELFLKYLPKGSKILDLGCGSGRDTKYFLQNGYDTVAIDGSLEMVKLSTQYTGKQTFHMTFEQLDFYEEFDGVWACASLLHVPRSKIDLIFRKIYLALKKNGIFYSSYKYGNTEEFRNGRFFNNYDESSFMALLKNHPYFGLLEMKTTNDVRKGRENEKWLNVILKKK
ncbi:Methyltransferase type 11 [Caldicellulosiruptor saccharolyticus DSM 8903]|uniref:Methyltransferase type 11 n=1 Tax=Caldicellulosiruptor saccharolyticus (strain ATCC 43494 / DSM 8903 / Tp8T 6331) TaxID=351627 RepID=A4XFJ3_CALS8|nr:class I SAM-dependent methyltransferase [Caldicellulosiruptor saccharolyticus]ABP65678.1 Methyltransferase type 11 [Caldicellulosiruptor saccharolyticus DSM 8903]